MSQNVNKEQNDGNITIPCRMLIARKGDTHNSETNCPRTHHVPFKIDEVQMHMAKNYHETNCLQRKDASDTITEYQRIFQWSPEGADSLLDIGSGSGDVTHDYILPIVPQKSQVVASDKSQEMVDYASSNFSHPRMSFAKLDIENEDDVNEVLRKYGQFQHITSFCALHWAQNQYLVMENIARLLQPGGDVFMTIGQYHPLVEHYADIYDLPKWMPFKADMIKCSSPYFRNENPEKELFVRMERAGFVDINVDFKQRLFHYDSQVFFESAVPIAPFLDNVSESLKQEFLQSYFDKVMTMELPAPHKSNNERNDGKVLFPFCMLVTHAKKLSTAADTHF